jgi:multiple sugar transport system substrate-binding protein
MRSQFARWSAVLTTVALATTACAQGTGSGSSTGADYDSEAKYKGTLTSMGFSEVDEIATTRLNRAEQSLGGASVKLTEGELDIQQFLSSVAAGEPSDVIYTMRDQIGTFASKGAIMPLTDCIEGENIDTSMFQQAALDQVTFGGEIYGIPEFSMVQIMQANSKLLDQAGLTLDDVNGSDWAGVTSAAKKLQATKGGELSVLGYDSKLPEFFPLWVRANGGDLLSDDGRTAQINSPEAVEALEFAVNIYDLQGGFANVKALRDSTDFFGEGNQFATGELGAMPMENWYVDVLLDVSPDAPVAFDSFRDKQGKPLAFTTGQAWAIPTGSKHPEAACRFAKTMTSVSSWTAAAKARLQARSKDGKPFTGTLTANTVADEKIRAMTEGAAEPWSSGVDAIYEANENAFALPASPADAEFKEAWESAVNRVLNGQQEPQEALDQAQQEAQSALDSAWAEWDKKNN